MPKNQTCFEKGDQKTKNTKHNNKTRKQERKWWGRTPILIGPFFFFSFQLNRQAQATLAAMKLKHEGPTMDM